jgi:hypothetical protein
MTYATPRIGVFGGKNSNGINNLRVAYCDVRTHMSATVPYRTSTSAPISRTALRTPWMGGLFCLSVTRTPVGIFSSHWLG